MIEFAISFYQDYTILFFAVLIVSVILEWPISIITLSILWPSIGIWYFKIFMISIIWEFIWDLWHYILGRYFKKNVFKEKNYKLIEKVEEKIKNHSIFEKFLIIKYTPPITSIWLIYLGFSKVNFKLFFLNVLLFSVINWVLMTFIWYNIGTYISNTKKIEYIIIWIMLTIVISYFWIKYIWKIIVKRIK